MTGSDRIKGEEKNSQNSPIKPQDFTRLSSLGRAESFINIGKETMSSAKKLEWLASEEIAQKFEDYGLFEHLGHSTTNITIEGIEADNLCVYTQGEGKNTTYYITTSDKVNQYGQGYNPQAIDKVINEIIRATVQNPNKIKWDLPKIHAVRTADDNYDSRVHGEKGPILKPKVLITDSEKYVRQKIRKEKNFITNTDIATDQSNTEQPTENKKKGWRAVLPNAKTEIEISSDKEDNKKDNRSLSREEKERQELIYKVFHGEISKDEMNGSQSLQRIHEVVEKNKKDLNELEGKVLELYYYTSNQDVRKKCIEQYRNYLKYIDEEIENNANKDQQQPDNTKSDGYKIQEKQNILKEIKEDLEGIKKLHEALEESIHGAVEHQLSQLGFSNELQDFGKKKKIYIKGDLYLPKEGNGNYLLTAKKLDKGLVPVDYSKQLEKIEPGKVQCDLKVYMICKYDKSNGNKVQKTLITDDRNLVENKLREGWKMARPGTKTGIELGNEANYQGQKEFYDKCRNICEKQDHIGNQFRACEELFSKLYWNDIPGNGRGDLEVVYQNALSKLAKEEQKQVIETFKQGLINYIKNKGLADSFKEDLQKIGAIGASTKPDGEQGKPEKVEKKGADSPKGAENGEQTSGTPKVTRGNTNEVQSREQDKNVNEVKQPDKDVNLPLSSEALKERIDEEIAVARAYYEMFSKVKGVQLPETNDKRLTRKEIENIKIEGLTSEQRKDFLEKILDFNKRLRAKAESLVPHDTPDKTKQAINEKDLNPFQLALSNAIETIRKCKEFAENWLRNYEPWFDFNEPWIKQGMDGIEPKKIGESYANLCKNNDVEKIEGEVKKAEDDFKNHDLDLGNEVIPSDDYAARVVAYNYSSSEIVQTYKRLIRASASLKDISDKLKDGIPAPEKPERINGLDVIPTPGAGCNCLIDSVIGVSNPGLLRLDLDEKVWGDKDPSGVYERQWSIIELMADAIRQHLIEKEIQEKIENVAEKQRKQDLTMTQEQFENESNKQRKQKLKEKLIKDLKIDTTRYLNSSSDLPEIVKFLESCGCIERSYKIRGYEWNWQKGRIKSPGWLLDRDNDGGSYYSILNQTKFHNEAMVKKDNYEQKMRLTEGGKKYAKIAGLLIEDKNGTIMYENKKWKWNDKWDGVPPEKVNALANEIKADLEKYKNKKQDEEVNGKRGVKSNEGAGSKKRPSETTEVKVNDTGKPVSEKRPEADRPPEGPRQVQESERDSGDNRDTARLALKNTMSDTRTLHQWATRFQSRFDLNVDWVQEGMKQLGINNFHASLAEFNKKINDIFTDRSSLKEEILNGSTAIEDIVKGTNRSPYDASKIVQDSKALKQANEVFRPIQRLLRDGIPFSETEEPPKMIKGLIRVETSGSGMNCLIHALLKVACPGLKMKEIVAQAAEVRKVLEQKLNELVNSSIRESESAIERNPSEREEFLNRIQSLLERQEQVSSGGMLDLGDEDGQLLFRFLADEVGMMDRKRGLLVYKLENGRIQDREMVDINPGEEPYVVFLRQNNHFEAMVKPEDLLIEEREALNL